MQPEMGIAPKDFRPAEINGPVAFFPRGLASVVPGDIGREPRKIYLSRDRFSRERSLPTS